LKKAEQCNVPANPAVPVGFDMAPGRRQIGVLVILRKVDRQQPSKAVSTAFPPHTFAWRFGIAC
jgi:hypothetical protein